MHKRDWGRLYHVSIANLTATEISKWSTERTAGWNEGGSEFAVTLNLNQTRNLLEVVSGEVIGE